MPIHAIAIVIWISIYAIEEIASLMPADSDTPQSVTDEIELAKQRLQIARKRVPEAIEQPVLLI